MTQHRAGDVAKLMMWHRVFLEAGRPVTGRQAPMPGAGVWIGMLPITGESTTHEIVAVDGVVVRTMLCYCGYDRMRAFTYAASLLPVRAGNRKGRKRVR